MKNQLLKKLHPNLTRGTPLNIFKIPKNLTKKVMGLSRSRGKKIQKISNLLVAHRGCGAPLVTIFFQFLLQNFFNFFLIFFNFLFLISVHYGLISGQIALRGQTSRKVTRRHTTPAQARLTSEFYPTPATAHFTGTC